MWRPFAGCLPGYGLSSDLRALRFITLATKRMSPGSSLKFPPTPIFSARLVKCSSTKRTNWTARKSGDKPHSEEGNMPGVAVSVPVVVHEETVDVWVMQVAKSWRAHAMFRGREIKGTGSSQSAAVNEWRDRANYAANESEKALMATDTLMRRCDTCGGLPNRFIVSQRRSERDRTRSLPTTT